MTEQNGIMASALVATLERAWAAIVGHHPEVPEVVVVASGSGGRARESKLGHFAAGRWEIEGGHRSELLVDGEGLALGRKELLNTLLHEAAHGLGWARGLQNTSRGGRYHNRRYKALAEEMGLGVAQVGSIGWSGPGFWSRPGSAIGARRRRSRPRWCCGRRAEAGGGGATAGGRNLLACRCRCGRRIRVARATLADGPDLCGCCDHPFLPVRGADEG